MAQIKRETASICTINDLLKGTFIKTEGWNPSYFSTELGNLTRVNIMGFIVTRTEEGIVIDDGTGRILLRSFEDHKLGHSDIGDFVIVIGRPRVYNEQKYIMPEIIKKLDPAWIEYRKAQLDKIDRRAPEKIDNRTVIKEDPAQAQNPYQKIMEFIRDLDQGNGAEMEEVIKRSGAVNAEMILRKLIEEGEIFEIKPGKLKMLE
jgi:RPA family protein